MTYYRSQYRKALIAFCEQLNPTYALTLCFGRNVPYAFVHSTIRYMDMKIDRLMLGRFFYEHPSSERTRGLAFIEHLDTDTHAHLVIATPNDKRLNDSQNHLACCWEKRTRHMDKGTSRRGSSASRRDRQDEPWKKQMTYGHLDLTPINRTPGKYFDYITKEAEWEHGERGFILLSEYHN